MIDEICQALQKTFDPSTSHTERINCQHFLESIKTHPDAIKISHQLCTFSNEGNLSLYLKNYGLLLLEERVKYQWNFIDSQAKNEIKSVLERLFPVLMTMDSARFAALQHKYSRIVAATAVREWPQLWPSLSQLLGQVASSTPNQWDSRSLEEKSLSMLVCMIFGELCEQVFAPEASSTSIEDERRSELATSISLLAKSSLIPHFLHLFGECCLNFPLASNTEWTLKVLLRCFVCCYAFCSPCEVFLRERIFLPSLVSLLGKAENALVVANYAAELVEIVCSFSYDAQDEWLIAFCAFDEFLLCKLDLISGLLVKFLASPNDGSKSVFLTLVVALEKLVKIQICHPKHPFRSAYVASLVKLMMELQKIPAIQVICITSSIWPLFLRHEHWRSQSMLIHELASGLLNGISIFLSGSSKVLLEKSRAFAEGELTVGEFEMYHSQVIKNFSETIVCVSEAFPDEICTFCLPALLECISPPSDQAPIEWTSEREKKIEALLFFIQNVVRAFIDCGLPNRNLSLSENCTDSSNDSGREMRQKIDSYFCFTLGQLCLLSFSDAESIFYQLDAISGCLKYALAKSVGFEWGILYTKMFHLIYEFQDANTLFKTRVKERVHSILNAISQHISQQDALMFIQYGLEISKSGYIFPEMNTVLIDFLMNISLANFPTGNDQMPKFSVLELASCHIFDAASKLELGISPKHFLSLVGMYLAANKKRQLSASALKSCKFLEGDLQPCHEISAQITKLITLLSRITQRKASLPSNYLNDCLFVIFPKLLNFISFIHSLPGCDSELECVNFVFLMPFHAKSSISSIDSHTFRAQTSDSTLDSFLNRFSNWYDGIKRSSYQLIGIAFEFESFWINAGLIDGFLSAFGAVDSLSFDLLGIASIFDSLFQKFILKCPAEFFSGAFGRFLFPTCLRLSQRLVQEWNKFQDEDADTEAGEEEEFILKSLRSCNRSLVSLLALSVDKIAVNVRSNSNFLFSLEHFDGFLQVFYHFISNPKAINQAGDGILNKYFDFLFKVLAIGRGSCSSSRESDDGSLAAFSQFICHNYNSLIQAMISALKSSAKKQETQGLLFSHTACFAFELHSIVDFFAWIEENNKSTCEVQMLEQARRKFGERTAAKSKKEVIRGVLKHLYEVRSERENEIFKVKNLAEKLNLLRKQDIKNNAMSNGDEGGGEEQDDEDLRLSSLFE